METVFSDDLRSRALICAFVALAAGIALLITAGAGRRPPADSYEQLPSRPGPGASVTAFLMLGAAGAVLIAWEIRQMVRYPEIYPEWYVGGDRVPHGVIDPPPGWGTAALALLCLVAAASALFRAVHARPFGLVAAALLLPGGVLGVVRVVHYDLLDDFGSLPTETQLMLLSWIFEVIAALVVLLALAPRGFADVPGPYGPGQGPGYGPRSSVPPATPPPRTRGSSSRPPRVTATRRAEASGRLRRPRSRRRAGSSRFRVTASGSPPGAAADSPPPSPAGSCGSPRSTAAPHADAPPRAVPRTAAGCARPPRCRPPGHG